MPFPLVISNIAKGKTDLKVERSRKVQLLLCHNIVIAWSKISLRISTKYWTNFSLKISTKLQLQNLHKNSASKFQPSFELANIDAPVRLLHWQALSKHPNSTKQSQSLTNIDNDRIRWKGMEGPGKLFLNCLGFAKVSLFLCHSKIVWWLGWVWRRNRNGLEKWLLFPAVPRGEPDNIKNAKKYWD